MTFAYIKTKTKVHINDSNNNSLKCQKLTDIASASTGIIKYIPGNKLLEIYLHLGF